MIDYQTLLSILDNIFTSVPIRVNAYPLNTHRIEEEIEGMSPNAVDRKINDNLLGEPTDYHYTLKIGMG